MSEHDYSRAAKVAKPHAQTSSRRFNLGSHLMDFPAFSCADCRSCLLSLFTNPDSPLQSPSLLIPFPVSHLIIYFFLDELCVLEYSVPGHTCIRKAAARLPPFFVSAGNPCQASQRRAFARTRHPIPVIMLTPKSFRIRTSKPSRKCSFQRTYRNVKCFRIRTYKKSGGGLRSLCGYSAFACCERNMLWGVRHLSTINAHKN